MAEGTVARTPFGLQVARFRKRVTFSHQDLGRQFIGTLPKNAQILALFSGVKTAFNATNNVLTVGTNGTTANNIAQAGDISEETPAGQSIPRGAGLSFTQPTDVYFKLVTSGTTANATTGVADLVLAYVPGEEGEIA